MGVQRAGAQLLVVRDVGLEEGHPELLLIHHADQAASRLAGGLAYGSGIRVRGVMGASLPVCFIFLLNMKYIALSAMHFFYLAILFDSYFYYIIIIIIILYILLYAFFYLDFVSFLLHVKHFESTSCVLYK